MDDLEKTQENLPENPSDLSQEIIPVNPEPVKAYGFPDNRIWGHLDQFEAVLRDQVVQKERSQQTYEAYKKAFRQFREWGKKIGNPPVTPKVIRQYKESLIGK